MPRTSVRRLMIAIALGAIAAVSVKWLIVGDGGYEVQLVNGLGKPIRDVRLVSGGVTLAADELPPGAELHGRLRAKRFSRDGMLQSVVEVSYRLGGKHCRTSADFGMNMLRGQPIARMTLFDHFGQGAINLAGGGPEISALKSWMRSWWFWLFHG